MPAIDIQPEQIPDGLRCPISRELLDDPVLLPVVVQQAKNGAFIFSRQAIEFHLSRGDFKCPLSKQTFLPTTPLIPMSYKKREVNNWLRKNNLLTFEEFCALIETDNDAELAIKRYPSHFLTNRYPKSKMTVKDFAQSKQLKVAKIILNDENNPQIFIPAPEAPSSATSEAKGNAKSDAKNDAKGDAKDEKSTSTYVIDIAIPEEFRDPLHKGLMSNPVATLDGVIFDYDSLDSWFKNNPTNYINPATGDYLYDRRISPVTDLKQQINSFLTRHRCHSYSDVVNIVINGDVAKLRSKRYLKTFLLLTSGEWKVTLLGHAVLRLTSQLPMLEALWQDILQAFDTKEALKLLNAQDERGDTILHYAVIYQLIDVICWLIKNKADYTIKDKIQKMPFFRCTDYQLNLVAKNGHFENLQKLLALTVNDKGQKLLPPDGKDSAKDTTQEMTACELAEYEVNRLSSSDDEAAKAASIAIAKLVNPLAKDSKKRKLADDSAGSDSQLTPFAKSGTGHAQASSKKARSATPVSQKNSGLEDSPISSRKEAKMTSQGVGALREHTLFAVKKSTEERISLTKTTAVQYPQDSSPSGSSSSPATNPIRLRIKVPKADGSKNEQNAEATGLSMPAPSFSMDLDTDDTSSSSENTLNMG